MKPKKPRKPEVVEVRFRLLTDATNKAVMSAVKTYVFSIAYFTNAKLVRKPTVERVGKR